MIEAMVQGFSAIFRPDVIPLVFLGIIIGVIVGVIPGISGLTMLPILLPIVYGMDPAKALAFLLSFHAVCYTGGSVTAIVLGIPGTPPNAATVIDGFPMAQKGEGSRAIAAAVTASGVGGVLGGLVLFALIPVCRNAVMAFGSPEIFFLVLMGITFIAAVGAGGKVIKGLLSGGVGLFLSLVGYNLLTSTPRFTFGSVYLSDGIEIIPLALGLFAIPTIIELAAKGKTVLEKGIQVAGGSSTMRTGFMDVFQHWWLTLRSSAIGTWVGILPGIGGETAPFVAYGHAKQTSKHPELFGTGYIEGVIAPESSNNAKEGGALVPTLAFGIPGSSAMAILLGALVMIGIEPGPNFLKEHLDLAYTLTGTVIFANIVGAVITYVCARQIAKVAEVPGHILAPILLTLITIGAFSTRHNYLDVVMMLVLGVLGYAMATCGFNRPALLLGYVLGDLAEVNFFISLSAYGPLFFVRPISLTIIALIILGMGFTPIKRLFMKLIRR